MFAKACDNYERFNMVPKAFVNLFSEPRKEFQDANFKELLITIAKTISAESIAVRPLL